MPSNLVKMQKFQTFQKKKRDEKYILTNDAGPLREIFFSWSIIRQNKKERKNWGRFLLNNDYFLHCNFEKKISVCFHKQTQIERKNKQTSYMSTFQISNFQCRTWFFLHECMKNKRYFQNSFLYLNINWYLNSNRVLIKIWGRIEFKLSSNRVLHRVEKQIPFLHSYILYYCFNLIANESFDELCNTFRIRKKM